MILQPGGKDAADADEVEVSDPASRNAISNELSFSRCRPTPLVRKIFFDTNIKTLRGPVSRGKGLVVGGGARSLQQTYQRRIN